MVQSHVSRINFVHECVKHAAYNYRVTQKVVRP